MKNMKKKSAIVTIYDPSFNYGNKLQNYASLFFLEKMGIDIVTLITPIQFKNRFLRIKIFLNKVTGLKLKGEVNQAHYKRGINFMSFNKRYLKPCNDLIRGTLDVHQYKYFFLGSDQVWNATCYNEQNKQAFMLTFAESEQKICLAPSFGVEALPREWEPWFKEQLATFPDLSVREEAGAKIIKDLTGREATVLIDPTMMLDRDEWNVIAKKPNRVDTSIPFILTYLLGKKSKRVTQDIEKIAQKYNFAVYNLLDISQLDMYASGPREFVYLFSKASLIMTDSFHGCVFSFLYDRPFLVYRREDNKADMFSRIEMLLKKFAISRKYIDSGLENELFEADYSEGKKLLEMERKKFKKYLIDSMKKGE